jgi:hypothetical protein
MRIKGFGFCRRSVPRLRLLAVLRKKDMCQSPYGDKSNEPSHETIPHEETPFLSRVTKTSGPGSLLLLLRLGLLAGVFRHLNFNCRVAWLYRKRVHVDGLWSHAAPAVAT